MTTWYEPCLVSLALMGLSLVIRVPERGVWQVLFAFFLGFALHLQEHSNGGPGGSSLRSLQSFAFTLLKQAMSSAIFRQLTIRSIVPDKRPQHLSLRL